MFFITHKCLSFPIPKKDIFKQFELGNNKDGLLYYYRPAILNFLNNSYIDFLNSKNEAFLIEEERKNKPKKTAFFQKLFGKNKNKTTEQTFKFDFTRSLNREFKGKYDFDILVFELLRNEILSFFKSHTEEEIQLTFIHNFIQSLKAISKEEKYDFSFDDHFHKPDRTIKIPKDDYAYFLAELLILLIQNSTFEEDYFVNLIGRWLKIKEEQSFQIAFVQREDLICGFNDFNQNKVNEILILDKDLYFFKTTL